MKERIQNLKDLTESGINRETFFKMILHCTDHYEDKPPAWANYLKIDIWQKLYAKKPHPDLNLSEEQLLLFFNYMSKYHHQYIGRNTDIYYVHRNFENDLRTEENFSTESVIFQTLELS